MSKVYSSTSDANTYYSRSVDVVLVSAGGRYRARFEPEVGWKRAGYHVVHRLTSKCWRRRGRFHGSACISNRVSGARENAEHHRQYANGFREDAGRYPCHRPFSENLPTEEDTLHRTDPSLGRSASRRLQKRQFHEAIGRYGLWTVDRRLG
eukprot:1180420-Prorocentrum_minimum.AAC.2